jgi:Concanavalin A-like lectin/glucanases superfamily/Domain of unknown function (DUF2341)
MAFGYYSPDTVNTGQVPSTQTNFPRLVSWTDNRFKTVSNGGHVLNSSGFDIRPYSDSSLSTALTYELERYNASTGEVVMWVKRSSLADGNVTYLAYGNSSLTTDGSDGPNTFSNSFVAVYHLKDGTTLSVSDSSGSNNGTNHGATATTGKIDGGASFVSASSQYVDLGTAFGANNDTTLSAWVNATSFPNAYNSVVGRDKSLGGTDYFLLTVKSTGKLACLASNASGTDISYDGTGSHTLSSSTSYHLAMTYNSTAGLVGYVNAASDGTHAANGNLSGTGGPSWAIAKDVVNAGRFWNGTIDEVRVSSVARSADWITTEYNNQSAPGTFATLGTEVSTGTGLNSNFLTFFRN